MSYKYKINATSYVGESHQSSNEFFFADNLSYAKVVINLSLDEQIVATYSDDNAINNTCKKVRDELDRTANNASVEFVRDNGIIVATVKLNVNSTSDAATQQASITNMIKKHFNNEHFYVSVNVEYYVNSKLSVSYTNGIKH